MSLLYVNNRVCIATIKITERLDFWVKVKFIKESTISYLIQI